MIDRRSLDGDVPGEVSVRRVEDITDALWGIRVSAGTVSDLNQKMYERIEAWRSRKIEKGYPCVSLDGISLKRTWGGEVRNVSILVWVAVGVGEDGYRDILGIAESCKEDQAGWAISRHASKAGVWLVRSCSYRTSVWG